MFTLASKEIVLTIALVTGVFAQQTGPSLHARSSGPESKSTGQKPTHYREDAQRVLWLGLHHAKAGNRTEAVKALSLMHGNSTAIKDGLTALGDPDAKVRTAAATTLGELHATAAIPALKDALADKEITVMLASAHALYLLKDPGAYDIYYAVLMGDKKTSASPIEAQLNRLKDPKQVFEMGLQEGLGAVPYGGMGYEAYRALMNHDNSPVRAAAARILALDPDPVTEDALVQSALADKSTMVREAALDALAQRGDWRCIERLEMNLHEVKYAVRYRTAATIIHLSGLHSARSRQR
jgi:HEAT repeat protein